jgi:hypothetical protein
MTERRARATLAAVAALALTFGLASCRDVTAYEGMRITIQPSRAAMHAGDELQLAIVVQNTGAREESVDLMCPSISIAVPGGESVMPHSVCTTIAQTHRLLPNEAITVMTTWHGESAWNGSDWTYARPGEYQITAQFSTSIGFVDATPVKLAIVP